MLRVSPFGSDKVLSSNLDSDILCVRQLLRRDEFEEHAIFYFELGAPDKILFTNNKFVHL